MKKTALYRHYNAIGELLYIGISVCAYWRFSQHQHGSKWVNDAVRMETQWFDSRQDALDAEMNAIKSEKPKFNVIHKAEISSCEFVDLGFKVPKEFRRRLRKLAVNNDSSLVDVLRAAVDMYEQKHPGK